MTLEEKLNSAAFLDLQSIYPDDLNLGNLESCVDDWHWFQKISHEELINQINQFEIVISNKVVIDAEILEHANQLKLICVAATGYNNVDIAAANQKGIVVCNVQHYATQAVVQHVFSLLLTLITQLDESRSAAINGQWSKSDNFCVLGLPITELAGKKIGIVGYGALGSAVAEVAKAFGMKVIIAKRNSHDKKPNRVDLDELLACVDVLSLHCPLNHQTSGMIGESEISLMKPNSIIINTSRGGLVDEGALLHALQNKKIAGAALDVLEQEPPLGDNQMINADLENLIVTPHVAWASQESRQRLVDEIVKNILAFKTGKPRNVIVQN